MRGLRSPLGPLLTALLLGACGSDKPPLAAPAPSVDESALRGVVRFDDAWTKVSPFVSHQAAMDLLTQCLNRRESELEAGAESGQEPRPLCVDRSKRDVGSVTRIRLETGHEALRDVTNKLRSLGESTHFVIERTGSVHQVLDLVYSTRRDEAYRTDEVRIVAAGPDGRAHGEVLAKDLRRLFPGAELIHVEEKP